MGWFKKLLGFAAVVGAAFLTFGGSLAAAGAWLASGSIGAMVARTVLTIGLSKLIANRAGTKAAGGDAPSARFQLRPSTTNKIPLIYGNGYFGSVITDAIISTDNKTMWYVMACAEVTDTGSISFGNMYMDNRLITFDGTDQTKVVSFTNNAGQVDTNIAGNMFVYKYNNGSSSGVNTAQTAIQVLQDSAIPVARRWTSTNTMTNTAFVIVKLIFNADKQVTGLGELKLNMINSLNKPGAVLLDYMRNTRYGCAIPETQIDLTSLAALDTYSDELITYTPVGGGSATQVRYRINGPIDLSSNCLSNLQELADACDSWIQYSELTGKWKVVINKPYTGLLSSLYSVDSSVLIGGIDVTPIDLNQTFNSVEIQYPSNPIKDQTDVRVIDLTDPATSWYNPALLSPNEANNRLTIQYNLVNNYVQGVYLGVRRLLQSREDLTINCNLDYSGIQIEAGDVVRVTLEEYGWVDKLFRVSTVTEVKQPNGNLGSSIVAFEYNSTIYNDQAIEDYVPADNTGLDDPNVSEKPGTPTFAVNNLATSGAVTSFSMATTVPTVGSIIAMDFNLGNSANASTHKLYSTVSAGDGAPFTAGQALTIDINDQPIGTYYGTVTARTIGNAGYQSNVSSAFAWSANLQANSVSFTNLASGTGGQKFVAGYTYAISSGNVVDLPIDMTGYSSNVKVGNYDTPKYLIGTNVASTKINPFYQGTSSTADGYLANSTAQYTPAQSNDLNTYNGDNDWWVADYNTFNGVVVPASQTYIINYEMQMVANANTSVQLCQFSTFAAGGGIMGWRNDNFTTYELIANVPYRVDTEFSAAGSVAVDGAGILMRNMVTGTQVDITAGFFQIYQRKS